MARRNPARADSRLPAPASAKASAGTPDSRLPAPDSRRDSPPDSRQLSCPSSRPRRRSTFDGFTAEDLLKLLVTTGFDVSIAGATHDGLVLSAVRRGIPTTITCVDRVPGQQLFLRVILRSEAPTWPAADPSDVVGNWTVPDGTPQDLPPLETTLTFDGGVTARWVMRRLQDWDELTWGMSVQARRKGRGRPPVEVVH